ncbi:MAG: hypothetical protein HY707_03750 [Ignavibacteriae bacterium]|nr:hypothetical protein [Ignavibacteriota bacterium]
MCWTTSRANNGGSGYSRYGIGDIRYFTTSRAMGMGGASLAVLSANVIDRVNPALWTRIPHTSFSASAFYEGFSTSDGIYSRFLSETQFNGFMVAVPLMKKSGLVFAAGITPFSRVNYNIIAPDTQANLAYTLHYLGNGGLSIGHVGASANFGTDLNIGAKLNYYFGALHHTVKQQFSSSLFTSAEVLRSTRLNGVGGTFGAVYTGLSKLFSLQESQLLTIGFVVTTTSYLTSAEERFYSYTTGSLTTRDTTISPEGKHRLPLAIGGGCSYQTDHFLLAADVHYQNWNRYSLNGSRVDELRDNYRFSFGGELLPKRDISSPFTQRIAYRFGAFYHTTYYQIKNEPINEIGLSGGLGIPIFSNTRFNLAVEYSFRGTTAQQLQKDKILRISCTLNVGELWFFRPPEE